MLMKILEMSINLFSGRSFFNRRKYFQNEKRKRENSNSNLILPLKQINPIDRIRILSRVQSNSH
jgi:hypothetical protein